MAIRTSTNFWIDLVSLVVMIGLAATGGLIHFVLPAGTGHFYALFGWNRHDIGQVHFYLAVAAILLLALHVLLHWSWICCVIAKMAGKAAPSQRSQTMWGLALLLGVALILGGGLWWASTAIQATAPGGVGRGRRVHFESASPHQAALASGHWHSVGTAGPTEHTPPAAAPPSETLPGAQRDDVHEQHLDGCPAGASIDGRTSLMEAARICGVSVAQLTEQLRLPANIDPREHLGRLKRRYGLDLHAVRRLACR